MRIEGGKTGTSWESILFPAAPSPFSKLYKLVKLGKEGHDDDDEEDSVEELLGQLLCDDFCSVNKSVQPVVVFPTRIIRAGA